jgi:hypothetical protein
MTEAEQIADMQAKLDYTALRLAVALDSEALALAALALVRQQAAGPVAQLFVDDADAANEPDPDAGRPVLPARALCRPLGSLKGRAWSRP